jgi:5-hydroxyisourate hydrolase-like protein (transthyretin family)
MGEARTRTTTLAYTQAYALPTPDSPRELAIEDGKLWVSYYDNVNPGGQAAIGSFDLTTAGSGFTPQALPGTYYYAPKLAVDPAPGGTTLVAEYTGISPWDAVGVYDVATTPPTAYLEGSSLASCPENSDIAVLPGGGEFVVAGCADVVSGDPPVPSGLQVISTTTLHQVANWYSSYGTPGMVTVAPNGLVAVGGGSLSGADVRVFQQGATTPVNAYTLEAETPPGSGQYFSLAARGLAFASDGSMLAGVAEDQSTTPDTFTVHGLANPAVTASSLSLAGPSSVVLGKSVTLTGTLAYTVGSPATKTTVKIVRSQAGSTATKVFTVATGAGGAFTLTDTPGALGTYTYTASYAGDATHQPATATRTVNVLRYPVTLTLAVSAGTVNYHAPVTVTAHLGTTYNGRTLSIYAQRAGSSTKTLLKTGRVVNGQLSVSYVPSYATTFSAVFPGDAKYQPKTVTHQVLVRVSVGQSVTGYYTSAQYGGTLYRVFHHTATLKDTVTVAPNKNGECTHLELDVYFQGQWQTEGTSSCGTLGSASKILWNVSLSQAAGYHYRIRTDFTHRSSDTTNVNNDSSWFYFAVTT